VTVRSVASLLKRRVKYDAGSNCKKTLTSQSSNFWYRSLHEGCRRKRVVSAEGQREVSRSAIRGAATKALNTTGPLCLLVDRKNIDSSNGAFTSHQTCTPISTQVRMTLVPL
jgi:hypothetical protein